MPSTTTERGEPRRDYTKVAVGSTMAGGASIYRARNAERSRVGGTWDVAFNGIRRGRVTPREAGFLARHFAVGGIAGTGTYLALNGARKKSRGDQRLDVRRDVIRGSVKRTVPGVGSVDRGSIRSKERLKDAARQKFQEGYGIAGGMIGGTAATALANHTNASIAGRKYLVRGGLGAAGMLTGVVGGEYARRRILEMRRQPVVKLANPEMSPAEMHDRAKQRARRKQQQVLSLTSAGLGVTALGMKAPQIARMTLRSKTPKAIVSAERRMNEPSNLVGTGAIGVGSLGSLNFARINRADNELETKYGLKKELGYVYDEVSKLGVPRIRPVRFGGVKSGGFYRRPSGTMGYRRGSLG